MTLAAAAPRAGPTLEGWMALHADELARYLERLVGSADEAQDLLQQVWIAAFRRAPEEGPGSNVRAWLYRVATHAALDRLAGDARRRARLRARGHELVPHAAAEPSAADGALRDRVRREVARLPRTQREAVWLRWIDELAYDQIAERLGCSREAARANVYQGMKRLRERLAPLWKE